MSIFGRGHYERTPILKGEDMPSNIYKIRNVLAKTYFKSLFHNITSEFVMMIGDMLGINILSNLKMRDDINVYDLSDTNNMRLETGLYIVGNNFSLYIKPGKNMQLIPYNLTNIAIETMQKPEFEAVYYCKFDETPLPVSSINATNLKNISNLISNIENSYPSEEPGRPHRIFDNNYSWNREGSTSIFRYLKEALDKNKTDVTLHVPKVRVNTWKIPIFTDAHVNTLAFVRDLDVQIDFMATPFSNSLDITKNLESAHITDLNGGNARVVPGEDLENREFDPSLGIYYTKNGGYIMCRTAVGKNYNTVFSKRIVYSLNKRPNRHCRYLVSAYGYADKPNFPNTEYTFPAQYLRVNKVYDTDAEQPLSSGFSQFGIKTYNSGDNNDFRCKLSYEGISPDPEDLTNPQDICVDFEFVQCKLDSNFKPIDTVNIGNKKKTLLGYLVLKAYSGIVGSTLHNGVYDFIGTDDDDTKTTPDRFTSYEFKTRPHDVFFKVTLRTSKYQACAGGNFTDVKRANKDDEVVDSNAKNIWNKLKINNTHDVLKIDNDVASKRRALDYSGIFPDDSNESPIYFAPTINLQYNGEVENQNSKANMFKKFEGVSGGITPDFMTSYTKSPDYMWGEYDFYKDRIVDKGGFLRPPIQDTIWFLREFWHMLERTRKFSSNYITGPINWLTVSLDKYYYDNDSRIRDLLGDNPNVGGVNLNFKLKIPDQT